MPIERRHVGKRLSEVVVFTPANERLVYLAQGLAVILAFIGVKLILVFFGFHIDIWLSLAFIIGVLIITTVASLIKVRRDPSATAHAGSIPGFESKKADDGKK